MKGFERLNTRKGVHRMYHPNEYLSPDLNEGGDKDENKKEAGGGNYLKDLMEKQRTLFISE